jgi:hypothetical protein
MQVAPDQTSLGIESLVFVAAAHRFNVPLTRVDIEQQADTWHVERFLDDIVDNPSISPDDALDQHGRFLDAVVGKDTDILALDKTNRLGKYALNFADWSPDRQYEHMKHLRRLGEIAIEKRSTTEALNLAELLTEEARRFALLLAIERSGRKTAKLEWFMDKLGIVANLSDTACDLKTDYDNGLTSVQPTIGNRIYLLRRAALPALQVINSLGTTEGMWLGLKAKRQVRARGMVSASIPDLADIVDKLKKKVSAQDDSPAPNIATI